MSTLSCENIVKDYPGTRALDQVTASFESGKINALLGKNGSGKSTLCKIFAGAEAATSGEFYLDGQLMKFKNPTDAAKNGIVLVYQETSLVPSLTVMENIFMGRLPKKKGGLVDWKRVQSETQRLLGIMDVKINPKSKIMHLPMWQRQVVEICKALSQDPKVLILDEPTSALAKAEVEKLFAAIRKVKENDVIIIYISHKLAEIPEIADTVTVLRDARYIGKKDIGDIDNAGMISMMFGKTEIRQRPADVVPTEEPVMEVRHLTREGWYEDISFTLYRGEVLGIAGVLGSGRTELLGGIFGSDPADSGEVIVEGKADAWLDLWCHTIFEDYGNAFSFLAPTVQYGKYGAVLTLETLGQRWNWEKTKVWRFFRNHGDVFSLYRLPSSYGCVIFNTLYPTGADIQLPEQDEVVSILNEILISTTYKYNGNSENMKVNHMVAWYSRKVISERQVQTQQEPEETRVADFSPILRAYISHGWNCKHGRNCQYACPGVIKDDPQILDLGYEIRGPCEREETDYQQMEESK